MTYAIEPMKRDVMDQAVTTLERAFLDDPMFLWIFPDAEHRARSLRKLNRVPLEYGLRYGHVSHANSASAVAIWLPPGNTMTPIGMIRSGMLSVPFQTGFGPFARFMGANESMEKIHKKWASEPHWYLVIICVAPENQGFGLGSALIREGLARADQRNHPCYLETSSEKNLAFYERHGFKVVESAPLGDGGPMGWGMRREPQIS